MKVLINRLFFISFMVYLSFVFSSCGKFLSSIGSIKADTAYNQGNFPKAIELYTKLIESSPDNADLHHKLGITYYSQGEKLKVQKEIAKLRALGYSSFADDLQQLIDK